MQSKTGKGDEYQNATAVQQSVKEYYGKTLQKSGDLKTSACTACGPPPAHLKPFLSKVPKEVMAKFYGCGNPIPSGIEGLHALDLGCGSGRDCYVAAQLVGAAGQVTGIDMTNEQLSTARSQVDSFRAVNPHSGPLRFLQGYIEDIIGAGVAPNSVDLVISNCVVNLSPNKRLVLEGAYKALKDGGEMYFSDVYLDRRLPQSVRNHELLFGECLAGALYIGDFLSIAKSVGFLDPRQLSMSVIGIHHAELQKLMGNCKAHSITFRLFKLPATLEDRCEDYGQVAYYLGGIPGSEEKYRLDDHHEFEKNRPVPVCGNTASMLQDTRLGKSFKIVGDRSEHFGVFPCGPKTAEVTAAASSGSGSCCEGAACA